MKFRRRHYITSPGFQWKMVLPFVVLSLLVSVVSNMAFNILATGKLDALRWSIHIDEQTVNGFLRPLFFTVNIASVVTVSLLLVIAGIVMMEKVKGPFFRISKELKRIREGDLEENIALRGGDEFKDVAEALNEMLDLMRGKVAEFKRDYRKISRDIERLEIARAEGKPIKDEAVRLAEQVKKLRERVTL